MGWILGLGNGVVFRTGSSMAWSSYWSHQSEVLFFGLYSEISGGQMPNKVPGATDFLTVAGVAGSETYQAPNTAPYIAADTDYIWFKTDSSQRTTTTAELIGYDFIRTIVKYDNSAPYAIEAIMILNSDVDTAKMRDDFALSVWWSNVLSAYGNVKGNRGIGKAIWLSEFSVLSDTHTKGYYDYLFTSNLTIDINDKVGSWADRLASGVDLLQATTERKPLLTAEGVLFDGLASLGTYLQATFALTQPVTIYMIAKVVSLGVSSILYTGKNGGMHLYNYEALASGKYIMFGGSSEVSTGIDYNIGVFEISIAEFNGASSNLKLGDTQGTNKSIGTSAPGGFTLGQRQDGKFGANICVKSLIIRDKIDTAGDKAILSTILKTRHGL